MDEPRVLRMSPKLRRILAFLTNEDGPTAVEYGILLALIIVVLMGAITAIGNATSGIWASDVQKIDGAMS